MQIPLEIRFRNMDPSPAVETAIRKKVEKLERYGEHILNCSVTVEVPHKHQAKGTLYRVVVDIRVPGGEIVASRDPGQDQAHEDIYVALRDSFKAARRQLQNHVRVRRG